MELIKALLALITSFFQNSTAKKKEEVSLTDVTEKAVVEEIRASTNARVVQQQQQTNKELDILHTNQQESKRKSDKKTLDEQLDDQFGGE